MAKRRDRRTRTQARIDKANGRVSQVYDEGERTRDGEYAYRRNRGRRGVRARARNRRVFEAISRANARQPSGGTITNS